MVPSLETLSSVLLLLNSLTPIGLVGLLSLIAGLLLHKRGPLRTLTDNHLSHIQQSLDRIAASNEKQVLSSWRQEVSLNEIKVDLSFLKGKLD